MLALLHYWVAFPLAVLGLALGLSELLQRLAGSRFAPGLGLAAGLAALIAVANLAALAPWLTWPVFWAVTVLAVAGLVLGSRGGQLRPATGSSAVALVTFAVLAAPYVLSGQATFGGYGSIGDPAFQMLGIDTLLDTGLSTDGLPVSVQRAVLEVYFAAGYPTGGYFAAAIPTRLVGGTALYSFQPFIAILGAAGATASYGLFTLAFKISVGWRAVAAALVGLAPMLVAFANQGSVKEVGASSMLLTGFALTAWVLRSGRKGVRFREGLVLAVPVAAGLGVIGVGIGPWLAVSVVLGLICLVLTWAVDARQRGAEGVVRVGAAVLLAAAAATALAFPGLLSSLRLQAVASAVLTTQVETGNLMGPMPVWQPLALWPTLDYRTPLTGWQASLAAISAAVSAVLVVLGTALAVRDRRTILAVLVVATAIAYALTVRAGSPYADAKAAAVSGAPLILGAVLLALGLQARSRSIAAGLVLLLVGAVVLTSDALGYRGVLLAPRDRLQELSALDEVLRDLPRGPVLMTEFEEYAKVVLRDPEVEVVGERIRGRTLQLSSGGAVPPAATPSIEQIATTDLRPYRYVIQRRGPSYGNPGPAWKPVSRTRHYMLYTRSGRAIRTLEALDSRTGSGKTLNCENAPRGAARGFVQQKPLVVFAAGLNGARYGQRPGPDFVQIDLGSTGELNGTVQAPRAGRYAAWLEGTFSRGMRVYVDGRRLRGVPRYSTNERFQAEPAGGVTLDKGEHRIRLVWPRGGLRPGTGRGTGTLTRFWLAPSPNVGRVQQVGRERLCERRSSRYTDWILPGAG